MQFVSVFTCLVILSVGVTHLGLTHAGRLPKAGGRVSNMQEEDGGLIDDAKPAKKSTGQTKHLNRQGSVVDNQRDGAEGKKALKKAAKEAFDNWQKDQYKDWQGKQPAGKPDKDSNGSEEDNNSNNNNNNVEESQEKFQKLHKIRKSRNQQHEVLDDDEEREKEKLEEEELSVLFPKVVEEEPLLVEAEQPARPVHKASKEEVEQQEEMKKHNKQWREQHPGRKQDKHKIDEWQKLQNEEFAKQRKQFEQDTFDDTDDDTDMKSKMADEAEELRILEPHVETHNKAQKDEIKEHDAHKEEVIDLLNPEEVLHDGEKHAHDQPPEGAGLEAARPAGEHEDDEEEECEDCRKLREESEQTEKELNAKLASEADELRALEPHVETHTKVEKKVDEILKNRPFSAGDIESAVHGGDHVHGEHDGEQAGPRDVEHVVQGGAPTEQEEGHGEIGVEDPEMLMHGAGGHQHGAPEGKDAVGLHVPEDIQNSDGDFAHDDSVVKMKVKENEKSHIGMDIEDIEKAVEGDDLDPSQKVRPGKKITMQDILALGLSEDMLKGVDLTKIMEQDQKEYEMWQAGDDEEDDEDDDNSAGFWGQMSQIRKNYLDGLAARIRNIGVPDMENAEWDDGSLDDQEMPTGKKEAHPGESGLEHEMESWANTAPKGEAKNLHGKGAPTTD